jgi:class 3 adenylate cyclase/dihydrofolate reductase
MKLVVVEFMTLDGVMEAPGFEEHRDGRNAWAMRVSDEALQRFNRDQVMAADALLFGRTTYNIWAAFWPTGPEAGGLRDRINALPKYVVSKTLDHVDWENVTILRGDLAEDMREVKDQPGGHAAVYGSADLVNGLLELDLVDELRLILFPTLLGSGKRLFSDQPQTRHLRLIASQAFPSGAVQLTYDREGAPMEDAEVLAPYVWTDEHTQSFRAAEDVNRVLATVLFTDIVDSTGRAAAVGDREWRRLLDRHDDAARAEVARWNGDLVKHTGDGILARFDAPTRALRCAFGLRAALGRLGIDIRAGIHSGEVEVRRGDLGGIGVHIASRALAAAGSGEIVVTRTVRDLVTGTDLEFRSLGTVDLRGVPGQWELFAAAST